MWFSKAVVLSALSLLAAAAPLAENKPRIDYDAIVVGGGPAGLGALSALARVRRNVLLVDSGVYRNGVTRHMHDVLGFDGQIAQSAFTVINRLTALQVLLQHTTDGQHASKSRNTEL